MKVEKQDRLFYTQLSAACVFWEDLVFRISAAPVTQPSLVNNAGWKMLLRTTSCYRNQTN